MVILVTYSGTLTEKLRNSQEWDTMWMTGRQHGQMSADDDITLDLHKSIAQMNHTNKLHKAR